jgi:hypothetical protein
MTGDGGVGRFVPKGLNDGSQAIHRLENVQKCSVPEGGMIRSTGAVLSLR